MYEHDKDDFTYSSDTEWDIAEAYELGAANPDRAWVLTDRDVWHKNPFYHGPYVPHPEDEMCGYDYGDDDQADAHVWALEAHRQDIILAELNGEWDEGQRLRAIHPGWTYESIMEEMDVAVQKTLDDLDDMPF